MRVVIDTNIFISGIIVANSPPAQLLDAWKENKYSLLVSNELLEEIREVVSRNHIKNKYSLSSEKIMHLLTALKLSAEVVDPAPENTLPFHCRDPKDDMLLAAAFGGGADCLVTGDKDLLALQKKLLLYNIKITTVKDFLTDFHYL